MPKKAKGKVKAKSVARKSSTQKAASKKNLKKKTAPKKKTVKKAAKKKATKKQAIKKRTSQTSTRALTVPKKKIVIEPGPPPLNIPPVEEPATNEEAIGTVTHYYSHLGVAVVQVNKGVLKAGSTIHFKGHSTDFTQQIESMEYEHQHVEEASAGQSVGLKVTDPAREHDIVYLVK